MVFTAGLMEDNTREDGKWVNNMEMEFSLMVKEMRKAVSGKTEKF